jgi:hypothetical protein
VFVLEGWIAGLFKDGLAIDYLLGNLSAAKLGPVVVSSDSRGGSQQKQQKLPNIQFPLSTSIADTIQWRPTGLGVHLQGCTSSPYFFCISGRVSEESE